MAGKRGLLDKKSCLYILLLVLIVFPCTSEASLFDVQSQVSTLGYRVDVAIPQDDKHKQGHAEGGGIFAGSLGGEKIVAEPDDFSGAFAIASAGAANQSGTFSEVRGNLYADLRSQVFTATGLPSCALTDPSFSEASAFSQVVFDFSISGEETLRTKLSADLALYRTNPAFIPDDGFGAGCFLSFYQGDVLLADFKYDIGSGDLGDFSLSETLFFEPGQNYRFLAKTYAQSLNNGCETGESGYLARLSDLSLVPDTAHAPVPPALILFGSGLAGLAGIRARRRIS